MNEKLLVDFGKLPKFFFTTRNCPSWSRQVASLICDTVLPHGRGDQLCLAGKMFTNKSMIIAKTVS